MSSATLKEITFFYHRDDAHKLLDKHEMFDGTFALLPVRNYYCHYTAYDELGMHTLANAGRVGLTNPDAMLSQDRTIC